VRAPWQSLALRLYRLAVLVFAVWLMRDHHARVRIGGDAPLTVAEVVSLLPQAAELSPDHSPRGGMHVLDGRGRRIGYVVRTMPHASRIIGYMGATDTLVAFDTELNVVGVKVRSTEDTSWHLEDIVADRHFLKTWNNMSWDDVAMLDIKTAGIEGVSGASLTSLAIAEGITHRLRVANAGLAVKPPALRVRARDIGLALVIAAALALAFTPLHGRRWLRRAFQFGVIVYVGLINGDLIAQSLLAGWARAGVPWRAAPGLALLVAVSLLVPWLAKRPLYCQQICPHGALQEILGRLGGRKLRFHLPRNFASGLLWLPPMLIALVIIVSMLGLPFELAGIEPFDAYLISAAGSATIIVAAIGLVASLFIPQAYCRYGCPTGALLEFVRSHGRADRFGRRDLAAALLVALVAVLRWQYAVIHSWLVGS
jgi:hypothetical protein